MSKNVRIVINHEGIRELLRCDEVMLDLKRRALAIAAKAGPGMVVTTYRGANRVNASIITATMPARENEANHRALSSAIDAGRL